MYFTAIDDVDFAVKPMNCPGGILIYKSRAALLPGLPPAHGRAWAWCTGTSCRGCSTGSSGCARSPRTTPTSTACPSRWRTRCWASSSSTLRMYRTFGFENVHLELSTRPEKSIGSDRDVGHGRGALWPRRWNGPDSSYTLNPGDGAFYGPKIDFHIEDVMGRTWQCATCQLDFAMPERLRPGVRGRGQPASPPGHDPPHGAGQHRALPGHPDRALRRSLPAWLAPVQARGHPGGRPAQRPTRRRCEDVLQAAGLRVEVDAADGVGGARRSATTRCRRCPTCSWWATARLSRHSVTVRTRGDARARAPEPARRRRGAWSPRRRRPATSRVPKSCA